MTEKESSTDQGGAEKNNSKSEAYIKSSTTGKQAKSTLKIENSEDEEACPEIGAVLDDIVKALNRHVSLPEHCAEAIALYVAFSHVIHVAQVAPRLALLSPLPGCGKTTLLIVIAFLVSDPFPTSNTTPAVVFRAIDGRPKPTLLIDEADSFMDERTELANIIKGSHERAFAMVSRCDGDNHEVKHFKTFCCMVIARIGNLPAALESRCIVIRMRKAKPSETVEKLKVADRNWLKELRKQLEAWAESEGLALEDADPEMPVGFINRLADNWRPILAIADAAGGHWPTTARSAAQTLSDTPETSHGEQILAGVRTALQCCPGERISSAGLCRTLKVLSSTVIITEQQLAASLKPFGIKPKTLRIDGKILRGYEISWFEDAFDRYLPSIEEEGSDEA